MIRFKSGDPKGVPSGYERSVYPSDETVPACGIQDMDRALFEMFDKELSFEVGTDHESVKRVPVIFSSGEKWSLIKNSRLLRDKNDSIILPLITLSRTSIDQSLSEDVSGRGINQHTGELVARRKLSSADRDYQKLVNRVGVTNQLNTSEADDPNLEGQVSSDRDAGELSLRSDVTDGGLLTPDRLNNVWEVTTVPSPQFITARYEVIFWTQYMSHMNQLVEKFFASLLVPSNALKLETKSGYWFMAYLDGDSVTSENNFSDQSGQERIIRTKLNIRVPGYIVAPNTPGAPISVRKYVSCPVIQFSLNDPGEQVADSDTHEDVDYLLGADDPTLPSDDRSTRRMDQRLLPSEVYPRTDRQDIGDPALAQDSKGRFKTAGRGTYGWRTVMDPKTGNMVSKYVRIVSRNSKGEEVYANTSLDSFSVEPKS